LVHKTIRWPVSWFRPQNQMPRAQHDGVVIRARSGSFEARTHGVIARLASEGSKTVVHGGHPMGIYDVLTLSPLHGLVLYFLV
jgi:hypothetical protein